MEILLLQPDQISRDILNILNQLYSTRKLTLTKARLIIERQLAHKHYTYVLYDEGVAVGVGSLLLMEHLIHDGSVSGLIEDVAIHRDFHRRGYGKVLVRHLIKTAKKHGCYKTVLDCSDENVPFYVSCGMSRSCNQMRIDLV